MLALLMIFVVCGFLTFLDWHYKYREVVDSMMKVGEAQARLKQIEVALDAAELDKQNAVAEVTLAKEKAESSKSEVKRIELMVSMISINYSRVMLDSNSQVHVHRHINNPPVSLYLSEPALCLNICIY